MTMSLQFNSPFEEGKHRAIVKIIQDTMTKYYRTQLKNGEIPDRHFNNDEFLHAWQCNENPSISTNPSTYLVTIRLPNMDWDAHLKVLHRIYRYKNLIRKPLAVLEQSTESGDDGHHLHIACIPAKNRAEIIQRMFNAVKVLFKDEGFYDSVIDVKVNTNAYNYVLGQKTHIKTIKVSRDRELRKLKNYSDCYISTDGVPEEIDIPKDFKVSTL